MKKIILSIAILIAGLSLFGQDIVGTWNGVLDVQGVQLRVDFHITKTDDGFSSTMDSPDQGAFGIPTSKTTYKEKELIITVEDLTIEYKAKLTEPDLFDGTFTQMGQTFDMDLKRKKE